STPAVPYPCRGDMRLASLVSFVALGALACSSGAIPVGVRDRAPGGADGSGAGGTGGSTMSTDGGPCNAIVNGGSIVDEVSVAMPRPAPAGGTIADGTYHLTKRELYTGPGGSFGSTGHTRKKAMELTVLRTGLRTPWQLVAQHVESIDGASDERYTFAAAPSA